MSCIKCEHVTFSYENQVVVSDLSFQVQAGDYLCIIGENGTGKSTLMKGLLGLKKPAAGVITLGEGIRQNEVGYVPQQTENQKDFPASVWEVVLSGCLNSRGILPGFGAKEKRLAEEKLKLLGIYDLKNKSFRDLSGGQRQRALLARSLCAAKKLILLDEPTTGLDPLATEEFYHLLLELNKKHQITVIMVSHAIQEALEHADHILYLSQESHFFGTTENFMDSEAGRKFLGRMEE
ncbi:MAG: ABC transporter ATP-binding protein [Lachnospiraceae bacterium]|nr:ABC transporter ATP-binding protein [Lachnospiraceae bacterium]